MYWDLNNLCRQSMSHILSVRSSNKVQNTLSFNKEDFNKI